MVLIGLGVGYLMRKNIAEGKLNQAELEAARIIADGERVAESKKKEALLEAKEEIHKIRGDAEKENRDRRVELQRMERRILQKEEHLDKSWKPWRRRKSRYNAKNKKPIRIVNVSKRYTINRWQSWNVFPA